MRLKLDENIGARGAQLLRRVGHDVATVADQHLAGAPDRDALAACRAERRCLVTLDMDFANPLLVPPAGEAGIAVLRMPTMPGPDDLRDSVQTLAGGLARESIAGRLWIVGRGRIREYRPDTGEAP